MIFGLLSGAALSASTADLGTRDAHCRQTERGPSITLSVQGLKDRSGWLVAEVYPDDDADFLKDDNILIEEGKTFRRITQPIPTVGAIEICIRVPRPGVYAVAVTHKRDGKRAFSLFSDGIGFAGNPRLGLGKPHAAAASVSVGRDPVRTNVVMNYRRGLFSFGPTGARD